MEKGFWGQATCYFADEQYFVPKGVWRHIGRLFKGEETQLALRRHFPIHISTRPFPALFARSNFKEEVTWGRGGTGDRNCEGKYMETMENGKST